LQSRNAAGCCHIGEDGTQKGAPALVPAGMMGDRADVIFTSRTRSADPSLVNADDGAATA